MTLEVVSPTEALLDGRYLLKDRVGQGGMATVYRAEDTHLGRTVAIKMIHPGDEAKVSVERAHTEKALLASLNHPSLVTLFDAQLDPGRPQYLVMEFIDGPTLAQRMAQGPIPSRELAALTRDLAQGLAAAHAAGIVHRDVKPSNVLLQRRGTRSGGAWTAKLADFGIACLVDGSRLTTPGIVLGTLTYMAPEQLRDHDPGTPADIFALGLVVLEALTGEPGYTPIGSGRAAAIARLAGSPPVPGDVDPAWRDLLERMTDMEPDRRPTAAEVARAAGALLSGGEPATSRAAADRIAPPAVAEAATVEDDRGAADAETGRTAVLPAERPARVGRARTRVIAGAAALVVAGVSVAGAMALAPDSGASGSALSEAVARAVASVEVAPEEVAPEEVVTEAPVSDDVVSEPVSPAESVVETVDDGENGNSGQGEKGTPGNGAKDNPSDQNGNKPDHAGKPGKGSGD